MAVIWIILLATIRLALRAGIHGRRWNVADSDSPEAGGDDRMVDVVARAFILVLLGLLGLLALGMVYGNVLGA